MHRIRCDCLVPADDDWLHASPLHSGFPTCLGGFFFICAALPNTSSPLISMQHLAAIAMFETSAITSFSAPGDSIQGGEMPAVGRLGDKSKVDMCHHGCPACPHPSIGPAVSGSPTVYVNGKPVLRVTDVGIHAACCGSNIWMATEGSRTV